MKQEFYYGINNLKEILINNDVDNYLLVCDKSFDYLSIKENINQININHIIFNDFSSNPLHSDVDKGLKMLVDNNIRFIVAVGGGSSLDVAKCIKFDSKLNIKVLSIPTTAGTGSESTKHIVVYKDGLKESISSDDVIPNYVIFEPAVLETLPLYQKTCTLFDALSQSIESYWSINANNDTKEISKKALILINKNIDDYLKNNKKNTYKNIMYAANLSGQAINVTQTTAGHAMSYKITSMYNIPHGNACAISLLEVWIEMYKINDNKINKILLEISNILGLKSIEDSIEWFKEKINKYNLKYPKSLSYEKDIKILTESVNPTRLKNNPVQFDKKEIEKMYRRILKDGSI